jgi:hypothetical protein
MSESTIGSIGMLTRLGEDVQHYSARSLDLLRDIEATIRGLQYDQRLCETLCALATSSSEALRARPSNEEIDPVGKIEATMHRAQEAAKALYDELIRRRDVARADRRVQDEDGLIDEFTRTIACVADPHNAINALRWALGEHDADLSPVSGPAFETIDDLLGHLESARTA